MNEAKPEGTAMGPSSGLGGLKGRSAGRGRDGMGDGSDVRGNDGFGGEDRDRDLGPVNLGPVNRGSSYLHGSGHGHGSSHLDDEEFSECLAESPSPRAVLHLEACALCRAETGHAVKTLGVFREASREWSEARAARVRVRFSMRRVAYGARAVFAGILLAIVAPGGVYLAKHMEQQQKVAEAQVRESRAREIASDNALLLAVNQELDESVAPAMEPLLLTSSGTQASAQSSTQGAQVKGEGQGR